MGMKIYVGNLSYQTTEEELNDLFKEYGEVASVNIIKDRYTDRSKGFGFVEMLTDAEAEKAIENLNETEIKERKLRVNQAREKTETDRQPRKFY
ncbi:RNA-binding protein [bacterium]|nr:RNA-binding protein [bacterium]